MKPQLLQYPRPQPQPRHPQLSVRTSTLSVRLWLQLLHRRLLCCRMLSEGALMHSDQIPCRPHLLPRPQSRFRPPHRSSLLIRRRSSAGLMRHPKLQLDLPPQLFRQPPPRFPLLRPNSAWSASWRHQRWPAHHPRSMVGTSLVRPRVQLQPRLPQPLQWVRRRWTHSEQLPQRRAGLR